MSNCTSFEMVSDGDKFSMVDNNGTFSMAGGGSGGGGGGTTDYTRLSNKPLINGVTLEGDKTAEELGLLDRDEFFGEMELDTSEILAGYTNSTVGQNMTITSSTASVTIAHIIPVTKNGTYTVSIVNSASPAATTYRASAVCDTRGIILQSMRHTPSAGGTNTITFTAVGDGYLWLTIDVNYVSVSIKGPQMQTDIAELGMVTEFMKSAVHPSSLTDDIFRYEVDDLMSVLKPNNNNMRSISLYRNRIRMYPGPTATNGTTFYSFLVSNTPRYVGGNQASIVSHLTADDFVNIDIPDKFDLYFTRSRSAISHASGKSAGGFVVATRNTDTGEITVFTKAGGTMQTDATRPVTQIDNVTELLPEIRENGNIAVVFQSREPNVEQTWTFSLDVEQKGLAFDGYTGEAPENNGVASKKYDVGSYLIMHDHLYRVVAPIASGANITVGTNVVQTAIGEELASIANRTGTLEDEVDAAQDDIVELETAVGTKAPAIYETASGDIARFSDGADGVPMKSLVANIEPVQDLHGYDYPWPAGGGKNLLPLTVGRIKALNTFATWRGNTITHSGVSITILTDNNNTVIGFNVNGTSTALIYLRLAPTNFVLPAGTYTISCDGNNQNIYAYNDGHGLNSYNDPTETFDSETNYGYYVRIASGVTFNNQVIKPMLEEGSAASSYEPYSNICPISGWTGAEIEQTGKNLLAKKWTTQTINGVTFTANSDGTITANGTATGGNAIYYLYIVSDISQLSFLNGKRVTLSGCPSNGSQNYFIYSWHTKVGNTSVVDRGESISYPFELGDAANITIQIANGYTANNLVFKPMLELGSAKTEFEPYTGNHISVNWEDEAGTVYGGTLDVTNGVLTVDSAIVDLGALNYTALTSSVSTIYRMVSENLSSVILAPVNSGTVADIICSSYKTINANSVYLRNEGISLNGAGDVCIYDPRYNTEDAVTAFKSAVSGVQLVYKLKTPTSYQLTPQQINTLLGSNNIWTDVGTVDVEYPADTKLYIEQLTKPTEDDMTADHAISSGTFFMIGNTLYLATSQIAAGGTITPGTNATKLSLADALNQLNA